jgi:hypothetical protein
VSRSGTPTTPNAARKRPMKMITLSPEALGKLDRLAKESGESQSGVVERLILRARA